MSIKSKTLIISGIVIVAIGAATVSGWKNNVFLPWDYNVYGATNENELAQEATKKEEKQWVKIILTSGTYTFKFSNYFNTKVSVNERSFYEWISGEPNEVTFSYEAKDKELGDYLRTLKVPCKDAEIQFKNGKFSLIDDEINADFSIDELRDTLKKEATPGSVIDARNLCHTPSVTIKDLQDEYDSIKWINNFKIKYSDQDLMIKGKDLADCWSLEDGHWSFDIDKYDFTDFLGRVRSSYNTLGKTIDFKKHDGKTIKATYSTYGKHVDTEEELNWIKETIAKHKSIKDRDPVTRGYDDISTEWVEVSISDQKIWHVVNGKVHCESSIVTGTKGTHDTPRGVFYVSERIPGKYLRGPGYTTWVNRWMRLTDSGVGLHDATWRSSFGGSIYQYSGSHGCVNLPKSFAYSLYDELSVGTPVIIY